MMNNEFREIINAIDNLFESPDSPIDTRDVPITKIMIIPEIDDEFVEVGLDLIISMKMWNENGYMGSVVLSEYKNNKWSTEHIETVCNGWENFIYNIMKDKYKEDAEEIDIDTCKISNAI